MNSQFLSICQLSSPVLTSPYHSSGNPVLSMHSFYQRTQLFSSPSLTDFSTGCLSLRPYVIRPYVLLCPNVLWISRCFYTTLPSLFPKQLGMKGLEGLIFISPSSHQVPEAYPLYINIWYILCTCGGVSHRILASKSKQELSKGLGKTSWSREERFCLVPLKYFLQNEYSLYLLRNLRQLKLCFSCHLNTYLKQWARKAYVCERIGMKQA